jgi:uncharacterized membrane protein
MSTLSTEPDMALALALHLLAVILWVGGMAFALLVLRPALAALPPPLRAGVLARVFARFLPLVGVAVIVVAVSGGALLTQYRGLRAAPPGVHAMLGLGVAMMLIYGWLAGRLNPRLQAAVRTEDWPAAGATATLMRHWVAVNLVLGLIVIVVAIVARG